MSSIYENELMAILGVPRWDHVPETPSVWEMWQHSENRLVYVELRTDTFGQGNPFEDHKYHAMCNDCKQRKLGKFNSFEEAAEAVVKHVKDEH